MTSSTPAAGPGLTPQPQSASTCAMRRRISIGLPACITRRECRFPLTPEAAGILTERGYEVRLQSGAADIIHYTDTAYTRHGAIIVDRTTALQSDIVIHPAQMDVADIRHMRRGAMLLTLLHTRQLCADSIRELLARHIIAVAIDLIGDNNGHTPFADILMEIDGRAAIAEASALLAHPGHGKGILLGGVAGIVPCEVTILGSGIGARAAASSALGMGATVRMLDNDVYSLRQAATQLGPGLITSAIHPHVLENALRAADVVIATPMSRHITIGSDLVDIMKRAVIVMDLDFDCVASFPSLPDIDISSVDLSRNNRAMTGGRVCYTSLGNTVPRTAAMALSNTFLTLLNDITSCEGVNNTVKLLPGLQKAVFTFLGKPVNKEAAAAIGARPIDINLLLNCS